MRNKDSVFLYYLICFVMALASSTIFTTYSVYYVTKLELNPLQLVLVGTILELSVLLCEGITGVVADTYSRRLSVIIGMFVLAGAFTLEGSILWLADLFSLLPVFAWLVISQMLFGLGWTFVSGANEAWIVDEVGEEAAGAVFIRSKRYSLLGSLLGTGASVLLSMVYPNVPFLAGGLLYLLLGFTLLRLMKESGFKRRPREAGESQLQTMRSTWMNGAAVVRRSPLLIVMLVVTLFSGAASEGYDRLWQFFLIEDIGFPGAGGSVSMAVWFGVFGAVSTLLGLVAVTLTEKKADMSHSRSLSAALFILTAIRIACVIALALAPNFVWAATSVLLIGVAAAVSEPFYTAWLNLRLESGSRATVLSMMSQSDALGQTAGGPVVGWLGSRFSIRLSLMTAGVLLLPVLGIFGRLFRPQAKL